MAVTFSQLLKAACALHHTAIASAVSLYLVNTFRPEFWYSKCNYAINVNLAPDWLRNLKILKNLHPFPKKKSQMHVSSLSFHKLSI